MNEKLQALAQRQHGVFTIRQARATGMSRSAIRHRRDRRIWLECMPRVFRVAGSAVTERTDVMAAVLAAGPGACAAGTTAAALHGLPGFELLPPVVAIGRRPARRSGPVRESLALPDRHVATVDGIPAMSAARTCFDLCASVKLGRAARALDTALARELVSLETLDAVLDDLAEHGRAGTVVFRQLVEERRDSFVPPESELEARFLQVLRDNHLPAPEQQVEVADRSGPIGRVDFLWRDAHLVVETDGARFHDGLLDVRADAARDRRLVALGYRIRRYRWVDVVERAPLVVADLRDLLSRAA